MTDREWFSGFEAAAVAAGDRERLRLVELVWFADQRRETEPDLMLHLLDEARCLARRLNEPWWELFCLDRRAGALMKYKGDVKAGLELVVRNALEVRKPMYDGFPWRFRINDHLVVGYLNSDPRGYADEIREAIDWLERDVPEEGSPKYLVPARRRWLAGELGDLDEAEEQSRISLRMADDDPDQGTARTHAVYCYSHLCEIDFVRRDWGRLRDHARLCEALALEMEHILELAESLVWQALLARREGREDEGRRLFRKAARRADDLGMPPDHIFFDAVCAYHAAAGDLDLALATRDAELGTLLGMGRAAAEVRCRVERIKLKRKLGRCLSRDFAEAREAIARLRKPGEALADLAAAGGEA